MSGRGQAPSTSIDARSGPIADREKSTMNSVEHSRKSVSAFLRGFWNRMATSSVFQRLAGGVAWSVFGTGCSKVLTLVAFILVARSLGEKAYGEFGFVRQTALMFLSFSAAGVGAAATKYIAELLPTDGKRVGRIIGLSYLFTFCTAIVMSGVLYVGAPWLCETWLKKPQIVTEMRIGAVLLFIQTMMATQVGVISGFQDFRGLAVASFISGLFVIPGCVMGARFGGSPGALLGLVVCGGLNFAVQSAVIFRSTKKHRLRYDFSGAFRETGILWRYNLPTLLGNLVFAAAYWYCQTILIVSSSSTADVAIAYAALDIHVMIQYFPVLAGSVFLPLLSQHSAVASTYRKIVRLYFTATLAFTLLSILPVIWFSRGILSLYGSSFVEGSATLVMICLFLLPHLLNNVFKVIFQSRGDQWRTFFYLIVFAWVAVCVCQILVGMNWGSFGLAVGLFAGATAQLAVQMCYWVTTPSRKVLSSTPVPTVNHV